MVFEDLKLATQKRRKLGVFGWKYEGSHSLFRLSSPVCLVPLRQTVQGDWDHGLHWSIHNLYILAGIVSLDILYLEGKSPLLMNNIQVNFGDVLPESSKSSAFWDMGVDSPLKLLLLFSPMKHASRTAPIYFLFTRCFSQYYEYTQYHSYHIYNLDIRA